MKKRVLSILLATAMVVSVLSGCGQKTENDMSSSDSQDTKTESEAKEPENMQSSEGAEIALITDVGTIDDKSFNQGSWEGVEQYANENNINHKYYKPTEKSDAACMTAIDLAVQGGAKVVVTPGFLFEVPIFKVQDKYPDVKFVLLDGAPHDEGDYTPVISSNVLSIFYAEEQA